MDERINKILEQHISSLEGSAARTSSEVARNAYNIAIYKLTEVFAEINGMSYVAAMDQLKDRKAV